LSGFSIDKIERVILGNPTLPPALITRNYRWKEIRVSRQNAQKRDCLTEASPSEDGIDGPGRALLYTIPFSAWALQRITEAGVSLLYRNDDGVDGSTLPPIPNPDQRKRGHVFCAGFLPNLGANRPEYSYEQGVPWYSTSLGPIAVPLRADRRITRRALLILHPETASLCSFSAASLQRFALAVTRRGQPIDRSNRVPERLMPSLLARFIPVQIVPLDRNAPRSKEAR
jgi:hypothetical protein